MRMVVSRPKIRMAVRCIVVGLQAIVGAVMACANVRRAMRMRRCAGLMRLSAVA